MNLLAIWIGWKILLWTVGAIVGLLLLVVVLFFIMMAYLSKGNRWQGGE